MSGVAPCHYHVPSCTRSLRDREDNATNMTTMVGAVSTENIMTASRVERISRTSVLDRIEYDTDTSSKDYRNLVPKKDVESIKRHVKSNKVTWEPTRDILYSAGSEKSDYDIYGHPRKRQKDYPLGPEILTKLKVRGHAENSTLGGYRNPSNSWLETSSCRGELDGFRLKTIINEEETVMTKQQIVEVDILKRTQIERSSNSISAESIHTIDSMSVTATAGTEQESVSDSEETAKVIGDERDISNYMKPRVIANKELAMTTSQLMVAKMEEGGGVTNIDYSQSLEVVVGSSVDVRYEMEEPPCTCDKITNLSTVAVETKESSMSSRDIQSFQVESEEEYDSKFTSENRESNEENLGSLNCQKVELRTEIDDQRRLYILRKLLQDERAAVSASLRDLNVSETHGKTATTCCLLMAALSHYVRELCVQVKQQTLDNQVIEDITADSLRVVLEWIEMSTVTINPETVHDVFRAAIMLRVDSVTKKCDPYLTASQQSKENVELFQQEGTTTEVTVDGISHQDDHKAILDYSVECLCHWLTCDGASSNVRQLFDVACDWLKHRWSERKQYEARVMDCIDFDRFSAGQLRDLLSVELDPLVQRPLIKEKLISALLNFPSVRNATKTVTEIPETVLSYPRHDERKSRLLKTEAATKIQACYRSYRQRIKRMQQQEEEAAIKIQRYYRAYRARRKNTRQQQEQQSEEAAVCIETGHVKFMSSRKRQLLYETLRKQSMTGRTSQVFRRPGCNVQMPSASSQECCTWWATSSSSHTKAAASRPSSWPPTSDRTATAGDTSLRISGVFATRRSLSSEIRTCRSSREVFVPLSTIFLCFGGIPTEPSTEAEDPASQIFSFEVKKGKWSVIGTLPEPRSEMAACLLGSQIYVIGGYNPQQSLSPSASSGDKVSIAAGWSWELDTGYWNDVPDMLEARRLHHLVAVGGKLYAIGGRSASGRVLASVECYDPKTKQWSSSVPLEVPRYAAAVTVHNGNIWVCGGIVDVAANGMKKITDRVDVFQPLKNKWRKYKCLPAPRALAGAVSVNSRMLYVVGGVEFQQDEGVVVSPVVMASDLRSDSDWRHLTDLRCPRYKAIAIFRAPYLVVIGGEKCVFGPPLTTVECFNTEDEQWLALPDLPIALRGSCAITV